MNEQQPSDTEFVDGENYGGGFNKQEISFRSIAMEQFKRIGTHSAVEWHGGYKSQRPLLNGSMMIDVYVPDTREVYSNAVSHLADLLAPHFDEEMRKQELDIETELKKLDDKLKADSKFNYKTEKVKLKRKLFRHLSSFLNRRNYFEQGSVAE